MSSNQWPSERAATGKARKAPAGQSLRTDWFSGSLTTLFIVVMVAMVLSAVYLFADAVGVFSAFQQVSDVLGRVPRNS